MNIKDQQFLLDCVFNKFESSGGTIIYWRDCALLDLQPDEKGYLWVYEDGETFHSYQTPEQCFS